jgi:hypothetical protein
MEVVPEVYVVGYWSHVEIITTDKLEAEGRLLVCVRDYNGLPWAIRSIEEAIDHAYSEGYKDGYDSTLED